MKKIILFIMTVSLSQFSFAQSQNKKYKWGLSFAINSIQGQIAIPLMANGGEEIIDADGNIISKGDRKDHSISYSIVPKYYINNDFLLRFEFGITNLNLNAQYKVDDVYNNERGTYSDEVSHKIYRFTPGFQWFFLKEKKIESYCGLTVSYINYKSLNFHYHAENINLITDSLREMNDVTQITPGGFAAGAGTFAGFSIYLYKNISLGAELSSSALYYKLGGEATQDYTSFNINGPDPAITYHSTFSNGYKGFKISKIISSFNISFRL